ncbi:MAG TPA: amylo-alpha-1,6-glucosidase [Candidatus Acidoferrales bacterium]|nr:amylo-alpha-1,6-glucosidase [Candidatus Acidoferrales bacterium]
MSSSSDSAAEWLETDGLGGFASGTVSGIRTRRYHALLLAALTPPTGRFVLVNGFDAWVQTPAGSFSLTSHFYAPDVVHPDGATRIKTFVPEPWPRWIYRLDDGAEIEQELFVRNGAPLVALRWRLISPRDNVRLSARPFLSGRDYHSLHHENPAFRFDAEVDGDHVTWRPYDGLPAIASAANARYTPQPDWYRNFLYEEERARGLDCVEDLASPGIFNWDLSRGDAVWLIGTAGELHGSSPDGGSTLERFRELRAAEEKRRKKFSSPLERAADAYMVRRGEGKTIVAGYPWFTDWGRDTFIALRGLCLATGRLADARDILVQWAGAVSDGMLPNRFPDRGAEPEFNSVDASLWYVIVVHEFLALAGERKFKLSSTDRRALEAAIEKILSGYAHGTRYKIRMDDDGLLAAGEPGVQLTWMDAKIGDWVVTPRIGKPVEIQALWLNSLWIGAQHSERWLPIYERALESFQRRFWNEERSCLFDVVDVNHERGTADPSLRPNQIFAVGGLPLRLLQTERARKVVETVEKSLLTPTGLRSLAPGEPGYTPRYIGGVRERDGAYHQGIAWPWLMGGFVEGWLRVRGDSVEAKREAREKFLTPFLQHLDQAGLGHVSEIADAEPPYTPRGCPFQAWSLGELLRLDRSVLA